MPCLAFREDHVHTGGERRPVVVVSTYVVLGVMLTEHGHQVQLSLSLRQRRSLTAVCRSPVSRGIRLG